MTAFALVFTAAILGSLPEQGYVDVAQLVRSDPRYARVSRLRDAAERLRRTDLPAAAPTPPLPTAVAGAGANGDTGPEEDLNTFEVELSIYRAALSEEVESNRQRRLDSRSEELFDELKRRRAASRDDQSAWERSMAAAQVIDRATAAAWEALDALHAPVTPSGQAGMERAKSASAAARAVGIALAAQRRTEEHVSATRRERQQVQGVFDGLDRTARDERRQAERRLAGRESQLEDEARRRTAYRGEHFAQLGAREVDLSLGEWRKALDQRFETAEQRLSAERGQFDLAAEALDRQAAAAETELLGALRRRVTALLPLLGRELGIVLTTDAAAGWPDVTAQVAERLAALEAGPAAKP
ncbi:MAG: hypothetical protein HYU66_22895 [Armatimonadetes bacterium]|nr:hypothetical protein [Armatimonadota bacterium]